MKNHLRKAVLATALPMFFAACGDGCGGADDPSNNDKPDMAFDVKVDMPIDMTVECATGELECDGECIDPNSDQTNCGACGTMCDSRSTCVEGACALDCAAGQTACGDVCVDDQTNRDNCGACGTMCAAGELCSAGTCALSCQDSLSECDGLCVNTQSSLTDCGTCGTTCAAGEVCSDGACALSCQAGLTECNDTCADTQADRANCGACGMACAAGEVCSAGACALSCQDGLSECDGTCVDVQKDGDHCGACGTICGAGQACSAGACVFNCPAGQEECNGTCSDVQTDDLNCGACGTSCAMGQSCSAGACAFDCPVGQAECDGVCVDTQSSAAHCGACGTACSVDEACNAGACEIDCPSNQTECNGTCVDAQADVNNCGVCGTACATGEMCSAGACVLSCPANLLECDGGCVDTQSSPSFCGAQTTCQGADAGVDCNSLDNVNTGVCASGTCAILSCAPGFLDCDGDMSNGCEIDLQTDDDNCGACGAVCNGVLECQAGTCGLGPIASVYISSIDTSACEVFDHDIQTGDDRGGLATSDQSFWITGDSDSIIVDDEATTAVGGVALGQNMDGIFSDLSTGQIYSLSTDGTTPFDRDMGGAPYTFTHLLALDALTGAVAGTSALNPPITGVSNASNNLMLAGPGLMAFYDNNEETAYLIDPTTAIVTVFNAALDITDIYSAESWSAWGIVEVWDGDLYALYRASSGNILKRVRLSDGAPGPSITFNGSISDLASLTISLFNNRFYFHHESTSTEFGGGSETAGHCAMVVGTSLCGPPADANSVQLDECSGACVNQQSDELNCGACGNACGNGEFCVEGACSDCPNPGEELCNGVCANTQTDEQNCGMCGSVCGAATPYCSSGVCTDLLTFTGVQTNVDQTTLSGWTECFSETFGVDNVTSLTQLQTQCAGPDLMLACRQVGSTTLVVAAHAPRADVFFDTGTGNTPHEANGTNWYYNDSYSWGFAPMGETISRGSCDTASTLAEQRLCVHTNGGTLRSGYRCGATTLNGNNGWERVVFESP